MNDYDDFVVKEGGDKPIGSHPNPIIKKALENLYISIVGALDLGDFTSFINGSADLTYDEAKQKMLEQYGTAKTLSEAKLKARSKEAAFKLELAEQEARAEQRTLEEEFAEIEEVAHKTLADNLDLSRRNIELERELKRLKEEMVKAKAIQPAALPPGVPVPHVPAALPAGKPVHGSMYDEYLRRISEVITMHELDELASEIFDIVEREEYYKLTKSDTDELMKRLRQTSERRSMQLAEIRLPEIKPKVPEEVKKRKREKEEGPEFFGVLPPHVMYRYGRSEMETAVFRDIPFVRDHELERTILRNSLLLFPPQWFALPPEEKISRYGWDLASAMQHAVVALHKFGWDDLERDYGIPIKYIDAWRKSQ